MSFIILPLRFRVIILISVLMIIAMFVFIRNNSLKKNDYLNVTGKLTYLDKQMGNLPYHDLGKYRYAKIENYPYPFEVYADEQTKEMDSLKVGDIVTAYYYETDNTKSEGLNRFLQYLDKNNKTYFKGGSPAVILGWVIIVILVLFMILSYWLYKINKIAY